MNLYHYLIGTQYRESYGTQWKMKFGEEMCVTHTTALNQHQIEDFLCEQKLIWMHTHSRHYVTEVKHGFEADYDEANELHKRNYGEEIKKYVWKQGEPL